MPFWNEISIFAATVPATPLLESVPRQDFVFYIILKSYAVHKTSNGFLLSNACAHHARIWNRRFPTMPIMPNYLPSQWLITGNFRPNKLYPQLCCLAYLEQSIAANGSFSKRLLKLIDKSENVNTRSMGFPQEWKNEPLWIIKA